MVSLTKTVLDLTEFKYIIPSYQRGYRWSTKNVNHLLEDIYENKKIKDFDKDLIDRIKNDPNLKRFALLKNHAAKKDKYEEWQSIPEKMYCIQPLVIIGKEFNGEEHYEIIDGQQRVTTLSIFLASLRFLGSKYDSSELNLFYESRDKSAELMNGLYKAKDISEVERLKRDYCNNIDFEHMFNTFNIAVNYYKELGEDFSSHDLFGPEAPVSEYYGYLHFVLLKCVEVIWCDMGQRGHTRKEQKIFADFNTGKLPLTNSELVKAVFMNPANFGGDVDEKSIKDRQTVISEKWDTIETELHNPNFWAFVPHPNQYGLTAGGRYNDTRIDVIFDFLVLKKQPRANAADFNKEYYTFYEIEKWIGTKLETGKDKSRVMNECWGELRRIFVRLKELFDDSLLSSDRPSSIYNLSALYIYAENLIKSNGTFNTSMYRNGVAIEPVPHKYLDIFKTLDLIASLPRDKREKEIDSKIKGLIFGPNADIPSLIRNMSYGQEDDRILITLLYYNILLINNAKGTGNRFNFLEFAQRTWQREHIFATHHEGISGRAFQKSILEALSAGIEDADGNIQIDNAYLKYINYLVRGNENCWPNLSATDPSETECKAFNKALSFCKDAYSMLVRLAFKEDADIVLNLSGSRQKDKIYEYRNANPFFPDDLDIADILKAGIAAISDTNELDAYKEKLRAVIKEKLCFDAGTQIGNIFKDYDVGSLQTPSEYLDSPDPEKQTIGDRLVNNIKLGFTVRLKNMPQELSADDVSLVLKAIEINRETMDEIIKNFFLEKYADGLADNSMGNMSLLTGSDNASVGNKTYRKKAAIIYSDSQKAKFIPLGTLMVFTGAYSTGDFALREWLPENRLMYLHNIIKTLGT